MKQMTGFLKEKQAWQENYERLFSEKVDSKMIGHYSREICERPEVVGTEGALAGVQKSVAELKKAGLNPEVESYEVYMSYPKSISVTKTAPQFKELKVMEDLPEDTPFAKDIVPGYNAYTPSGEVEAELVYANYGRPEDFEELERRGISVKGKIVIARYGKNFRGVKAKEAEKHGAAGVLIYSDPIDDGYTKGAVYPDGPWRPADAIQRGSILYCMGFYPGDPLTPGEPSKPGVERIDPEDAASLPGIPTTPLAYGQAQYLLESMTGEEAPELWQGSLPFTYHLGPGSTKARLSLDIEYKRRPVHDIITRIPGSKYPEQTVLIGGHHDAWVYGADDNRSGWTTAMEVARVLGQMYENGWQPERTIIIAGWDGEEYGLLGSTEWAEDHRKELAQNAVAYLNMDGIAGQFFGASAVPSMNELIYAVTQKVNEPRSGFSIYDDWSTRSGGNVPHVGYLGGGSDYAGFLQHLGISSTSLGFGIGSGLYHSAYDNTDSVERFKDPGYQHHAAAAQIIGQVALRLANADVFPFKYSHYAEAIVELLQDFTNQYTLGVDVSILVDKAKNWQSAAAQLERQVENLLEEGSTQAFSKINQALMEQERDLTAPSGLPKREWFKHQIWAPGRETGYAVQPLPALAETLKNKDAEEFQKAVEVLKQSLEQATETARSPFREAPTTVE